MGKCSYTQLGKTGNMFDMSLLIQLTFIKMLDNTKPAWHAVNRHTLGL